MKLNWQKLGAELRQSALDAHAGELPHVDMAYGFLLDNPECFQADDQPWPDDMPGEPPLELIAAYYEGRKTFDVTTRIRIRITARDAVAAENAVLDLLDRHLGDMLDCYAVIETGVPLTAENPSSEEVKP